MADEFKKAADAAKADFPHNRLASHQLKTLAKNGFGLLPGTDARLAEDRDGYISMYRTLSHDANRVQQVQVVGGAASSLNPQGDSTMSGSRDLGHHVPQQMDNVLSGSGQSLSDSRGRSPADEDLQLKILEGLLVYLQNFDKAIEHVGLHYQNTVDSLEGQMMKNARNQLAVNHLQPTRVMLNQLQAFITKQTMPALVTLIEHAKNRPNI